MTNKTGSVLLPLVARLREASSRQSGFSGEVLKENWERFRQHRLKDNKPSPAILAALILDSKFMELLSREEFSQLVGLAKLAVDRYEAKNKTTKVGRTLSDVIRELL
jgi:hypothetical protein